MSAYRFANFVGTTLSAGVGQADTHIFVPPTDASRIPALGVGDRFVLVLADGRQQPEIVYVTARTGGDLTVLRGMEGTVPKSWAPGSEALNALTRDTLIYLASGGAAMDILATVADMIAAATAGIQGQITTINEVNFTQSTLITSMTSQIGNLEANYSQVVITQADLTAAFASFTTSLTADVAGLNASIIFIGTAQATFEAAQATFNTTITSSVATNTAAISTEASTRATADSALASLISTVSATAGPGRQNLLVNSDFHLGVADIRVTTAGGSFIGPFNAPSISGPFAGLQTAVSAGTGIVRMGWFGPINLAAGQKLVASANWQLVQVISGGFTSGATYFQMFWWNDVGKTSFNSASNGTVHFGQHGFEPVGVTADRYAYAEQFTVPSGAVACDMYVIFDVLNGTGMQCLVAEPKLEFGALPATPYNLYNASIATTVTTQITQAALATATGQLYGTIGLTVTSGVRATGIRIYQSSGTPTDVSEIDLEASRVKFTGHQLTVEIAGTLYANDLIVRNANIENAAITTAKIGLLAVDTAAIANLAVTTAKIANLAVQNAQIDNAAVTSAKIGNAEIKSANIDTLNVQTIHIANAAVSNIDAAYSGASYFGAIGSDVSIGAMTKTFTGGKCLILATVYCPPGNWGSGGSPTPQVPVAAFQMYEDGVMIQDWGVQQEGILHPGAVYFKNSAPVTLMFDYTPAAGAHLLDLHVQTFSVANTYRGVGLRIEEILK